MSWRAQYSTVCGAVAQLGERLNGIQEVVGSIPSSSTSIIETCSVRPLRLAVRTPPFHGGNRGSIPLGDAIFLCLVVKLCGIREKPEFVLLCLACLQRLSDVDCLKLHQYFQYRRSI